MDTNERVGRVMTEAVLSIDLEESAGSVLRLFSGYPIHHLAVLSGQKVVGMLSSADVMKLHAYLPKNGVPPDEFIDRHLSLDRMMSKPAITVQPHQSVMEAAGLMASHGVHALPVVDGQDRLLGMITTTDIMHATLRLTPAVADAPAVAGGPPRDLRLTEAAFERAVTGAKAAVDSGHDRSGMGAAVLFLQQRLVALERVMQLADRYVSAGEDQSVHAALLKAIEKAKSNAPGGGAHSPAHLGLSSE